MKLNMRFIVPLLVAASCVEAGYEPSVVKAAQELVLHRYPQFTNYEGPSRTIAKKPLPTATAAFKTAATAYWLEQINHQGVAAFNSNSSYVVFRNVQDVAYGAFGDGIHDDSDAINKAISDGNRVGPAMGGSSTNTAAVVYLPCGTYLISKPLIDYYYTQIIGNPNCMPIIRASPTFSGAFMIDGDQYGAGGLGFKPATNVFYRQIRNLLIDMTYLPVSADVYAVHWPTAQATSLQNIEFLMSDAPGTKHKGVLIESGSGGFVTDLVFVGGTIGLGVANQQFTMRNLSFANVQTAIASFFDWGWTYQGLSISNCSLGIDASTLAKDGVSINNGAIVLIDSSIRDTPVGVLTAFQLHNSTPPASGALILENIDLQNVPTVVQGPSPTNAGYLKGTKGKKSKHIDAWAQGNTYTPKGPKVHQGSITENSRPSNLLSGTKFFTMSKPQYNDIPVESFVSARTSGAVGNGVADDTAALQSAIDTAYRSGSILFVDSGTYRVTKTITIPKTLRVVGEGYSVIMSSGAFFNKMNAPRSVVEVGQPGDTGQVQISDLVVATQGGQAGAILMTWNLKSTKAAPSGLWDVHARIGGFIGSRLQADNCPAAPMSTTIKSKCIGAYLSLHITSSASGLYLENTWIWTADHDLDAVNGAFNQISVYTGRGLLIDRAKGPFWLYGTAVEHHSLYQYNFASTQNVVMGQIQTETPYWQPNPDATQIFTYESSLSDPIFQTGNYSRDQGVPNQDAFGLIVSYSRSMLVYGAGLYSFFNNYSTSCSDAHDQCQSRITNFVDSQVSLYDLHTVGVYEMITLNDTKFVASHSANDAGYTGEVAVFRTTVGG